MKLRYLILFSLLALSFNACKQDEITIPKTASITVINMVAGGAAVKVNPSGRPMSYAATTEQVASLTRGFCYTTVGTNTITAVLATDTAQSVFNRSVGLNKGMYTLYLAGMPNQVDTLFKYEKDYPFIKTDIVRPPSADSLVNVRFVNLSVGSPVLKIKIATATGNEVDNLPYKGISGWKRYNAKPAATTAYSFQIRRVDNDALVSTYNFSATNTNRFKNVSLVIRGIFGTTGTTGFGVTPINYF